MEKKLTIEKFGEIVDGFLRDNEVQMLITMPEGQLDAKIEDNIKLGGVMQFYVFLHAFPVIFWNMEKDMSRGGLGFDPEERERFIDAVLEILKNEALEERGVEI